VIRLQGFGAVEPRDARGPVLGAQGGSAIQERAHRAGLDEGDGRILVRLELDHCRGAS
jgi:hypothetical protein